MDKSTRLVMSSVNRQSRSLFTLPIFLAPAFSGTTSTVQTASATRTFSSSCSRESRNKPSRKNKQRGVSAMRSTGPRKPLSMSKYPLPKPVADATEKRAEFPVKADHGLWGFFNDQKESAIPPSEESSHGRAWTQRELSSRDFENLHKLYWTCVKELNRVATRQNERVRLHAGYGQTEADARLGTIKQTMKNIRQVLIKRHYAYTDARTLLETKNVLEVFPDAEDEVGLLVDQEYNELRRQAAEQRASSSSEEAGVAGQSNKQTPVQEKQI